ncbi:MBL fold metallo-hydrolase [Zobellella maritima]|uniref:MBL fold metallo-hydrolase n=1 Tax=Zobellella maritima TaxID=2059725 RepID=UPI000E307B18|nr:MBL fold metallo-hydrolase [Zobellella maritima]
MLIDFLERMSGNRERRNIACRAVLGRISIFHPCSLSFLILFSLLQVISPVALSDEQGAKQGEKFDPAQLVSPTRVVTLGTGTPNILPGRSGTATAVVVNQDQVYLFDAGSGFMETLSQFLEPGKQNIFPTSPSYPEFMYPTFLNKLFLTHLDSDHILGIPELLLRGWVLERNEPVKIWGPKGTEQVVKGVVSAYQPDIQHRLQSLPISKGEPYSGVVTEFDKSGVVYQDKYVTITAFTVEHGSWKEGEAFGYRIDAPDKSIVISGDTSYSQNLIENAKGADILLHEVMSEEGLAKLPEKWQHYMLAAHTTTRQLADIAKQVKPKSLVMIHPLLFGKPEESLEQELAGHYFGEFSLANDGDVFE